jgi:hypothetical protein
MSRFISSESAMSASVNDVLSKTDFLQVELEGGTGHGNLGHARRFGEPGDHTILCCQCFSDRGDNYTAWFSRRIRPEINIDHKCPCRFKGWSQIFTDERRFASPPWCGEEDS